MALRRTIQSFCEEVGADAQEFREVLRRMQTYCETQSGGGEIEVQGVGIFHSKTQADGFTWRAQDPFKLPERTTMAMRPIKRRRSDTITRSVMRRCTLTFMQLHDQGPDFDFDVKDGAGEVGEDPKTPSGASRNIVLTPHPIVDDRVFIAMNVDQLDRFGDFTGNVIRQDALMVRDGGGWKFLSSFERGFGVLHLKSAGYTSWFGIEGLPESIGDGGAGQSADINVKHFMRGVMNTLTGKGA